MTEAQFTAAVIEAARLLGYKVAHFRPAKTSRGWRTPVQGDGAGFPDLLLVGRGRIVAAELKVQGRKVTVEQQAWLQCLEEAGVEVFTWREGDWTSGAIERVLSAA